MNTYETTISLNVLGHVQPLMLRITYKIKDGEIHPTKTEVAPISALIREDWYRRYGCSAWVDAQWIWAVLPQKTVELIDSQIHKRHTPYGEEIAERIVNRQIAIDETVSELVQSKQSTIQQTKKEHYER